MAGETARTAATGCHATIAALVAADGSAGHRLVVRLTAPRAPLRDIADAIHCLGLLYGRAPGAIEIAAAQAPHPVAAPWLAHAADGFAQERATLARLTAAVGPMPSTPGQAESETAILTQRHAVEMLARSERTGCATGAAIGIVLDWRDIRALLVTAGERFDIAVAPSPLPDPRTTLDLLAASRFAPAEERAMAFGVQQALAQHRGLWNLLDARASARIAR